ncbi:MAG: TolC family protein [Verrucomicrobia bacterium]|nr:TolC family protein [Verrucomicrobiota bacterium]MDA1087970.1 TolC family protein [Verrucomicrobiota bacterium]
MRSAIARSRGRRHGALLLVLAAGMGFTSVYAQDETDGRADATARPARERVNGTLVLSLEHCLELALGANLDIQSARLQPMARGEDFFIAGETFQTRVFADGEIQDSERRTANTQVGADIFEETQETIVAGLSRRWPLGTRTDLVWAYNRREDNSEFRTLNPAHESSLRLDLVQPILGGFGLAVNRADLERAIADREIANREFEILLEGELLSTYESYWWLVLASASLDLEKASLSLADEQVALTKERLEAGVAAHLELVSAGASQARQREAVITAENVYRKASDQLLLKIRPATSAGASDLSVIPSTQPESGDALPTVPRVESALRLALAQRPELGLEQARIGRVDIDVLEARSERLPSLDLRGSAGFSGLADGASGAVSDVTDGKFLDWRVGATLSFFFNGKSRSARWRQAVLEKKSAVLKRDLAAAVIYVEVRAACFDLQTALQRLAATERTMALSKEQHEGELDRLKVGRSTLFQTDTFRRDLLEAERNHLRSRIDVFLAQALLDAAQGQFAKSIIRSIEEFPRNSGEAPYGNGESE